MNVSYLPHLVAVIGFMLTLLGWCYTFLLLRSSMRYGEEMVTHLDNANNKCRQLRNEMNRIIAGTDAPSLPPYAPSYVQLIGRGVRPSIDPMGTK